MFALRSTRGRAGSVKRSGAPPRGSTPREGGTSARGAPKTDPRVRKKGARRGQVRGDVPASTRCVPERGRPERGRTWRLACVRWGEEKRGAVALVPSGAWTAVVDACAARLIVRPLLNALAPVMTRARESAEEPDPFTMHAVGARGTGANAELWGSIVRL